MDGSIGIWHETCIVERANYEAVYSNMLLYGSPRPPRDGENELAVSSPNEVGLGFPPGGINYDSNKQPSGERVHKEGKEGLWQATGAGPSRAAKTRAKALWTRPRVG